MSPFVVSPECQNLGLRAGAIVLRDVTIDESSHPLQAEIAEAVQRVREQFDSAAQIRRLPELVGHHEILRQVGVKSRSHPPSTQKLLELALKRGSLPRVNNLVDAYNLVSVRTLCSLGAHDLERIATPVQLQLFDGSEPFRPLDSDQDQPVTPGEFGYVDAEHRVLCRLDCLQGDFSKITHDTTKALLIIEATTTHSNEQLERAFDTVASTVIRHCGGTAEVVALP